MAPKQQKQEKNNSKDAAVASSAPSQQETKSAASTSTAASRPPTGKVETITPSMQQLLTLNTEHIRDEQALASLKKLQTLRNNQNKNRQELRNLIEQQQASRAEANKQQEQSGAAGSGASRGKQLDGIEAEFKKLTLEKHDANHEMDLLRLEQTEFQRTADRVNLVDAEFEVALREARPARQKLADLEAKLAETSRQVASNKNVQFGGFASASSIEEELQKIASHIEDATQKNDSKLVAVHAKTQNNLIKAKREFLKALELEDSVSNIQKQVDKQKKAVEALNAKTDALEKERTNIREAIKNTKSFGAEFEKLRGRLAKVNNQLTANRDKRKTILQQADKDRAASTNPEFDARSKEIDAKRKAQDDIAAELDSVTQNSATFKRIEYDVDLRPDLVGRKGATIGQFQQDFGVYVDFDAQGWAVIVGGADDVDAAIEGIKQMCGTLRHSRQQDVVKFDPLQSSQIIGAAGANIRRFENLSGAGIKVDSAAGTATLTGTPENIATAKQLFDDHFKNNAEVVIPFRRDLIEAILGRGGATVRKVEQDSKCRRIRVDKDNSVLYCYGTQEACDIAKAEYQKILAEHSTPPFTQKVDDKQIRIIIGAGGATINELQKLTGAKLDIAKPTGTQKFGTLTGRGTKEALDALKKALDDLLIREEVKVPVPSSLFGILIDATFSSSKNSNNTGDDDGAADDDKKNGRNSPANNNNGGGGVCVLEEIRQSSHADQVSLIRSEGCVVIRGKREAIQAARHSLERFMIVNRPEVVRLSFCPALFNVLTAKKNGSSQNLLDSLVVSSSQQNNNNSSGKKTINIEINKVASTMEIVGLDKNQVQATAAELKKVIDDLNKTSSSFIVGSNAVKAIVGSGGSTIRDLQTKFKADINIARETNEVSVYCGTEDDLKACVEAIEKLAK